MFLILIVVTLENFLANTFYKEAPAAGEGVKAGAAVTHAIRTPVPLGSSGVTP